MESMDKLIQGLEALARAGKAQQESISLLGSTIHSQSKTIKALEDRVTMLEGKCYGTDTLATDTADSES